MIVRVSLWRANGKKCFYCLEPVSFRDLEIDHLVPESIAKDRLAELVGELGLRADFDVQSESNLVPTHGNCNSRKADTIFGAHNLRYYLEIWQKRQSGVIAEIDKLNREASNEKLLIELSKKVDANELSVNEIVLFLKRAVSAGRIKSHEPAVIAFSINLIENGIEPSPSVYDQLERELLSQVAKVVPGMSVMTEPSLRTGETLSVRIAFWTIDLNRLDDIEFSGWEILEVMRFSELYDWSWEDLLKAGSK
jgi:5-methylcytosine-specific restriction endonuclease McrA